MVKAGVNHRQNQQRQHGGKGEAEHDHHRHTLEKDIAQQRGQAKYGGEGGQQDRPQTRGCRINKSLTLIFLLLLLLYLFYQHNAVTDQHTAQAEQAD